MRSLLERTDRIDGDFVLAGHAVKQLLGTFQCACAQHLGQIVGGLIQVGKAQVLAHALERVPHGMLPSHFLPSMPAPVSDSCRRSKTSA